MATGPLARQLVRDPFLDVGIVVLVSLVRRNDLVRGAKQHEIATRHIARPVEKPRNRQQGHEPSDLDRGADGAQDDAEPAPPRGQNAAERGEHAAHGRHIIVATSDTGQRALTC